MANELSPDVRDRGLEAIGGAIITGLSPDLYDGLSEAEFRAMEKHAPEFFESWIGRHVGLPKGFDAHYRDDVLPDMRMIRGNALARDGARQELRDLLAEPERVKNLYKPGGETFSAILDKWADRVINDQFTRGDYPNLSPREILMSEEVQRSVADRNTGMFRRAPRAGRDRRQMGKGGKGL
jgi:hypothetical protein